MGRTKTLPGILGQINRHAAPGVAIIFTLVLGMIITLWLGLMYGPTTAFAFDGTLLTIPLLIVYLASCVSVPIFYYRQYREEFNVLRHVIVPAPPAPLNLAGPIVGVWFILGIIIVAILSRRAPDALARSNEVFTEEAEIFTEPHI